jgi:hypothetical protein
LRIAAGAELASRRISPQDSAEFAAGMSLNVTKAAERSLFASRSAAF